MNRFIIKKYEKMASTNTFLKENADSFADRTVIIADVQTSGRGRLTKTFHSEDRGGLYMSVLLKGYDAPQETTVRVAVCVHRAIKNAFGITCGIKWVNDIYYNGKKLCGILCERTGSGDIICGIGINVLKRDFPDEIKDIACALGEFVHSADKDVMLNAILSCFDEAMSEDFASVMAYYKANCFVIGMKVRVLTGLDDYEAVVLDITDDGNLIVLKNDGAAVSLNSGEISLKIRK